MVQTGGLALVQLTRISWVQLQLHVNPSASALCCSQSNDSKALFLKIRLRARACFLHESQKWVIENVFFSVYHNIAELWHQIFLFLLCLRLWPSGFSSFWEFLIKRLKANCFYQRECKKITDLGASFDLKSRVRQHQYCAVVIRHLRCFHQRRVSFLLLWSSLELTRHIAWVILTDSRAVAQRASCGLTDISWRPTTCLLWGLTVITFRLSFVSFLTPAGTMVADMALPTIASSCKQAGHWFGLNDENLSYHGEVMEKRS